MYNDVALVDHARPAIKAMNLPVGKILGSGTNGVAIESGLDTIKITFDKAEAQIMSIAIEMDNPILPAVHCVWQLPDFEHAPVFMIHREDLPDLKVFDRHRWNSAMLSIDAATWANRNLEESFEQNRHEVANADHPAYDYISQYFKGLWRQSGIRLLDLWIPNWGTRDGQPVVRDATSECLKIRQVEIHPFEMIYGL